MVEREEVGGEFRLSSGSGDEWFEVLAKESSVRACGEEVLVNRGDRIRVLFSAISQSATEWAEHGRRFALEGVVIVDQDGNLVMPDGVRQGTGLARLTIWDGNCIEFGKVNAHLD